MVVTSEYEDEKSLHNNGEKHESSSIFFSPNFLTTNKWKATTIDSGKDEKKLFQDVIFEKAHSKMNENFSKYSEIQEKKNSDKNSFNDNQYSARYLVALLGLAIAVVNCYAQATFCIAIVEMVLPSDYNSNIKSDSSQLVGSSDINLTTQQNNSQLSGATRRSTYSAAIVDQTIAPEPLLLLTTNITPTGPGRPADNGDEFPAATTTTTADQSCPLEYKYREYYDSWRFSTTGGVSVNMSATEMIQIASEYVDVSNRFDWDASRQGLLLGAFAVGTAPLQILGGRLAEIYGAKWVLLVGCIGTALTNLTIPLLAHYSFALLTLNRIVMGISQAGMEPGLMCLMANWLTPSEIGFFISLLLFAICTGFFLGALGSSFLLSLGYGWPCTYYVAGGANLLIGILWFFLASSRPRDSKLLSKEETEYIEHEQQLAREKEYLNSGLRRKEVSKREHTSLNEQYSKHDTHQWIGNISSEMITGKGKAIISDSNNLNSSRQTFYTETREELIGEKREEAAACQAPWMNILSSKAVWAFIICKFSIRWSADVLSIELPTYLANVLHLSIKLNGIVNGVSCALLAIVAFLTGYIVNEITKSKWMLEEAQWKADNCAPAAGKRGISKTNLRKVVQSIASFGSALAVFMMTQYDCNILFSMSMLFVLSCSLVMGTGGELQIPYDMTSRYPGTLHGLACTLSVSGWLAPPLIGLILGEHPSSRYRWSLVWYLTALINLVGGLAFVLFADASPCDFDRQPSERGESTAEKRRRSSLRVQADDNDAIIPEQITTVSGAATNKRYWIRAPANDTEERRAVRASSDSGELNASERSRLEQQVASERAKQTGWSYLIEQQELEERRKSKTSKNSTGQLHLAAVEADLEQVSLGSHRHEQWTRRHSTNKEQRIIPVNRNITKVNIERNFLAVNKHHKVQQEEEEEPSRVGWRMKQNAMWRLWTRFLAKGRRGKFSVKVAAAAGGRDSESTFPGGHQRSRTNLRDESNSRSNCRQREYSNSFEKEQKVTEDTRASGSSSAAQLIPANVYKNLQSEGSLRDTAALSSCAPLRGREQDGHERNLARQERSEAQTKEPDQTTDNPERPTVVVQLMNRSKSESNKFSSFPISKLLVNSEQQQRATAAAATAAAGSERTASKTITHL